MLLLLSIRYVAVVSLLLLPLAFVLPAATAQDATQRGHGGHDDKESDDDVELGSGEIEETRVMTLDDNLTSDEQSPDVVERFLKVVNDRNMNRDNCTSGVSQTLGQGVVAHYGVNRFKKQALTAVNQANLLTRLWRNTTDRKLLSEDFLFTLVRMMIQGDPDIFAAGNCHDTRQYKDYEVFCPFAHRMINATDEILVKDLGVQYNFIQEKSQFFFEPKKKAQEKLSNRSYINYTTGWVSRRLNQTAEMPMSPDDSLMIVYDDGVWGAPYFDCGGGNIWMMTYTVPFFGSDNDGKYYFKGTSGIDIDLQKVDIDQCPTPVGLTRPNVFQDTDKCNRRTTQCKPVHGLGFRRGSYICECKQGFYFPNVSLSRFERHYKGVELEEAYDNYKRNSENFICLPCAPGCLSCSDPSPCILTLDWVQRSAVLAVSCLIMLSVPALVIFTFKYCDVKVLKAASPVLLRIILFGFLLLYLPMIVQYFEPSELTCSLRMWLREIGFSLSYGALLLKTWRISVVFRVRSARAVRISDSDLCKRLVFIVALFAAYLTVRTVIGRPRVVKGAHSSGLHAFQCSWDVWDYCAAIAELCLLLWGIRLCIVVRKAPSEFNESRFISWAIYNETLLSLFLNITMFFLQSPANPDLLYLVLFIHTNLTTTVTLAFLFGSKMYLVYKYRNKEQPASTVNRGSRYLAAPKSAATTLLTSMGSAAASAAVSMQHVNEKVATEESESSSNMEKGIQEEFKRLYLQLETLKARNMKLGNPHLSSKLSAMTEAAGMEQSTMPRNVNGKQLLITDIDSPSYESATNV